MRYYADPKTARTNADGSITFYTSFPFASLAKIKNCLCADGSRRTVEITGEAETVWTVPARTWVDGKTISGFVSWKNESPCFTARGKNRHLIPAKLCLNDSCTDLAVVSERAWDGEWFPYCRKHRCTGTQEK